MNTKISLTLFALSLAVAPQVALAGQSFPLTAQTVDSWIFTGADRAKLAETPLVVLPGGAQLARNFESGDIAVNLNGGIVFGADPANWPVLEIGSAALVFVRYGEEGGLKLILGDKDPVVLPYVFKLDEHGRSVEPVQLTFALSGGMVAVNAQQKTQAFPGEFIAGAQAEVVLSAGAESDLSLTNFEVVLGANDVTGSDASRNSADSSKNHSADTLGSGPKLFPSTPVGTAESSKPAKKAEIAAPSSARKVGLVVFSASAFRLGRADSIRASASASTATASQK